MHKGGGLKRLPGGLVSHHRRGLRPEFVVKSSTEFRLRIAIANP